VVEVNSPEVSTYTILMLLIQLWCQPVSKTLQIERYLLTSSLVKAIWFFLRMREERPP